MRVPSRRRLRVSRHEMLNVKHVGPIVEQVCVRSQSIARPVPGQECRDHVQQESRYKEGPLYLHEHTMSSLYDQRRR